ncbi:copper chaperone PCu(A)C [Thalassospira mesophila]|uniref:copper chaperone PCu(A)C n=1 Tax=Thalassospira mesophila TaxID=1293891 RepID=UPI0013023940|nr:copper chaperone PCu(A)C [Thalassospira mesophila]
MNRKNTFFRPKQRTRLRKSVAVALLGVVISGGFGAAVVTMTPGAAQAHSYVLGKIMIGHFWAPPADQDAKGAAIYGPLLNGGKDPVTLVGATSPIADQVRFRVEKDGVESWVNSITLTPNKPMGLAAWREHIWLSGLKEPLRAGGSFDLDLDFGKAGHKTIQIVVEDEGGH